MTQHHRRRLAAPALALAGVLLASLAGAAPASAAGSDYLRYQGKSLNMARVPAGVVTVDALSKTPARSATYLIGDRVLATDTTLVPEGDRWLASVPIDLTGQHDVTRLTVKFEAGRSSRPVWSYFRAIPPPSATPVAGTSVAPAGPATTGVPRGTRLTPSGPLDIRTSGTVVDGLDVDGCVTVSGSDVVIRNTRIRCDRPARKIAVMVSGGGKNLVLEDVEIDGRGTSEICVGWSSYTLRRANVHDCADGARFSSSVSIEDSWVHDMVKIGTLHPDALQTTGGVGVTIRGNTLQPQRSTGGDVSNAALMLGSELKPWVLDRVVVEDNYLDGGGFSLNVRGDVKARQLTVRNNRFGDSSRFGPVIAPTRADLGTGNVYAATGGQVRLVTAK